MAKITLDAKTFQALASSTRLTVLRALDERRKTLTELARDLALNKATVHEHLQLLASAGLVKKRDDEGRKWIYYELTWTGEKLLHPQETTTFNVLLGLSIAAAGGGVAMLGRALGLWLATRPISSSETTPSGLQHDIAGDSDSKGTAAAPATAGTETGNASGAETGTASSPPAGGAGGMYAQTVADTAPQETASPAAPATEPHGFFDDGGWLGLALMLAAIVFTVLALALRNHLKPGKFVPPEGVEPEQGDDPIDPE